MNRIEEVIKERVIEQVWLAQQLDKNYNIVNGYRNDKQLRMETCKSIIMLLDVYIKDRILDAKS